MTRAELQDEATRLAGLLDAILLLVTDASAAGPKGEAISAVTIVAHASAAKLSLALDSVNGAIE